MVMMPAQLISQENFGFSIKESFSLAIFSFVRFSVNTAYPSKVFRSFYVIYYALPTYHF
jgi:hypothetical protein